MWPRKNATTLIINFKDIVNKTDLFSILPGRKFIFKQNDTMTITFGWGIWNLAKGYFSEAMSFSKFATFSTLAIFVTARIFRFTASRRITCCVMNSSVCSHCLCEVRMWLWSKELRGRRSTFWKWHCLTKIALGSRHLTQN